MAFQGTVFQTVLAERAYELSTSDTLALDVTGSIGAEHTLTITQELSLAANAALDPGGPTAIIIRYRVFTRHPSRFEGVAVLSSGENEALAEPVLFFHKDAQVNLDFTLLNPDGSKYNLTGATVDLLAKPERGAALTFACSVLDASNGLARRIVAANDFAAGPYQAQIRVTIGAVVFHSVYFRILIGVAIV